MMRSTRSSGGRFVRRLLPLLPFLGAAGAAFWAPAGASASTPSANAPASAPLQTAASSGRASLPASVHPWTGRGVDVGRMDGARRLTGMSLLFKPSDAQKAAAAATLRSLQDPTSPSYHRWLTPDQYAARFGVAPADIARASSWLASQGLTVDGPSRTGTRLGFSGSVAAIEAAFGTEMHLYEVDGAKHFAMARSPSVPSDIAGFVLGLHGMHDFRVAPPRHPSPKPSYTLPVTLSDGGTENIPSLAPADFAAIYDVQALYAAGITGAGQKIAVAEQTDFNDADIAAFRSTFSLATNAPVRVPVPNSGNAFVSANDLGEAELDTEWAGAVATDATIEYVFTGDTDNNGVFDSLLYAIEQATAPLVSLSYGSCESGIAPSDIAFYEATGDSAAMMGITVLVSSGDSGAAGCDGQFSAAAKRGEFVGYPASIPTVTAVGGTQFQLTKDNLSTYLDGNWNALGYIPESGWNETWTDEDAGFPGLGASTGGVSVAFAKPYWQVPFTPKDKFRDVPDVALTASAAIMPYVTSGSWTAADGDAQAPQTEALQPVGGTSCAAPSFAGILALVNQAIAKAQPTAPVGLGNANPVLYALANNQTGAAAFHDVTTGDNIVPCQAATVDCPTTPPLEFGYTCAAGYDQVTGLGSVDAAKLVAAWTTLTPTATTLKVTPSGTTAGSPLQLDATVASTATANGLTGSVTFYYETFDANGNIDLGGVLGSVPVTATSAGPEGATASLKATAPAGATGGAKVSAFYGGDVNYLASWSTLASVAGTSSLAICPTTVTLTPGQTGFVFQTTGGVGTSSFMINDDTTCQRVNRVRVCSSFDDAGVFTAGPVPGTVSVLALDQAEAYVTATVTVAGSADSGAPLPVVSCGGDAGPADGGASDASSEVTADAAIPDAATSNRDATIGDGGTEPTGGSSKSGCGCVTAGAPEGELGTFGWGGLLLGFAALSSRRRRPRT